VPASEQYHRVVADNSEPGRNDVFLTGVPGAGKTTYVLRGGEVPQNVRVASIQGRLLEGLRPFMNVSAMPSSFASSIGGVQLQKRFADGITYPYSSRRVLMNKSSTTSPESSTANTA
jgi:hypothetical protein